jgi:hypothetical protein
MKRGGTIEIIDSLQQVAYLEEPMNFVRECVVSCIMVRPSRVGDAAGKLIDVHWEGTEEMLRTLTRYRAVNQNSQPGNARNPAQSQ